MTLWPCSAVFILHDSWALKTHGFQQLGPMNSACFLLPGHACKGSSASNSVDCRRQCGASREDSEPPWLVHSFWAFERNPESCQCVCIMSLFLWNHSGRSQALVAIYFFNAEVNISTKNTNKSVFVCQPLFLSSLADYLKLLFFLTELRSEKSALDLSFQLCRLWLREAGIKWQSL